MDEPYNFVLIGRSGCGKGTQAELLIEKYKNLYHISTGDLFRGLAKADTAVGAKIREIIKEGGLPFDDLATALWMHEISFKVKENQGIIADGMPRRLNEAKNLDHFIEFLGRSKNTFYLLIDISRQEAFDRLTKRRICKKCGQLIPWVGEFKKIEVCNKCGGELVHRQDDTPEAINNRLDYFDEQVSKAINYYDKKGELIKINGDQSIEGVFSDIIKEIENRE
jgi:adenylate kinase